MSNLQAFFAQNIEKTGVVERVVSNRFKDENGNPIKWKFEAIDAGLDKELRKQNTKRKPVPGKKNMFLPEVDLEEYKLDVAVATVKFPDLHNAELQDSYGVMEAKELLSKMLLPGEITTLLQIVQEVNGYDISMEDLVEEAKN